MMGRIRFLLFIAFAAIAGAVAGRVAAEVRRQREAGEPVNLSLGQDVAQVQIARILVVVDVAAEAEFPEQQLVGGLHRRACQRLAGAASDLLDQRVRHVLEASLVGVDVDVRILGLRDQERRAGHGHLVRRPGDHGAELLQDVLVGGHRGGRERAGLKPSNRMIFTAVTESSSSTPTIFTSGYATKYANTGTHSIATAPLKRFDPLTR